MKKIFKFIFAMLFITGFLFTIYLIADKMFYHSGSIALVFYDLLKECLKIIGKTVVFTITFAVVLNAYFKKYINKVKIYNKDLKW